MSLNFSYCGSHIQVLKIANVQIIETIQMHAHAKNGYEIHYIDSGKGTLVTPKGEYALCKGSLFITGPGIKHKQLKHSGFTEACKGIALHYLLNRKCFKTHSFEALIYH